MRLQRYEAKYDYFWQDAHRLGENRREGLSPQTGINPMFRFHQDDLQDLEPWIAVEGIHP